MMLPSHGDAGNLSARASGTSTSVDFVYLSIQQNIFKMPGREAELKDTFPAYKESITIINSHHNKGTHNLW